MKNFPIHKFRIADVNGNMIDAPRGYQQSGEIVSFDRDGDCIRFAQMIRGKIIMYETNTESLNLSDQNMLRNASRAYTRDMWRKKIIRWRVLPISKFLRT
jgi:hypothetical protein